MPSRLWTASVLAMLLPAGCMRMTRSSSQTIDVQTNPPGATVTIRPAEPGEFETPAKVSLSRKSASTVNVSERGYKGAAYIVTASKSGYRDSSVPIDSKISTDTWVRNLIWIHPLLYGLGVLVDLTSGTGYELRPSSILLVLEPQAEGGGRTLNPMTK